MQNVNFKSIDDFLDFIPENERQIVDILRGIVTDCIPGYREKLSYNVPYYFKYSRICFIWPSSIKWGNVKSNGVLIGFCYGNLLNDAENYLDKGSRKQVYTKTFMNSQEIDIELLSSFIYESVLIDDNLRKSKKKKS